MKWKASNSMQSNHVFWKTSNQHPDERSAHISIRLRYLAVVWPTWSTVHMHFLVHLVEVDSESPLWRQLLSRFKEGGQQKKQCANASVLFCLLFSSHFHNMHRRMSSKASPVCPLLRFPLGYLLTRTTPWICAQCVHRGNWCRGWEGHQRDKHLPAVECGVSASLTTIHLHSSQYLEPVLPVMKSCNSWGGNLCPIYLTLSSCHIL